MDEKDQKQKRPQRYGRQQYRKALKKTIERADEMFVSVDELVKGKQKDTKEAISSASNQIVGVAVLIPIIEATAKFLELNENQTGHLTDMIYDLVTEPQQNTIIEALPLSYGETKGNSLCQ